MSEAITYSPPWRNVAETMFNGQVGYGDEVSHEVLNEALGMPEPRTTAEAYKEWALKRMTQLEALKEWLLKEHSMCLASIHGRGFRVIHPHDQTDYAQADGLRNIRRELGKMAERLYYVNRSQLTHEQARANADAMARAAFIRQSLGKAQRMRFDPPQLDG